MLTLSRSGGLLRSVIDAAPVPMWLIGPDGSVDLVNEAATTVLGYQDERQLIGQCSHEALHACRADGSPYPSHQCPIVTASGDVESSHPEEFVDRQGRALPVRWTLRQLDDSAHRLLTFTPDAVSVASSRSSSEEQDFQELLTYIRSRCCDPRLTPAYLAQRAEVSLRTLQGVFSRHQTSPAREIRQARLAHGHRLLQEGRSVTETAYTSGFNDVGTFSRAYRRAFGQPPVASRTLLDAA